jgi:DNA-binding response OmpR family regulator
VILIAHESEVIREVIRRVVEAAGWRASAVAHGKQAVAALVDKPAALVLDVALPDVHAFEVVEEARRQAPETRVVLVASVYNRTGYKRRPTSLYGADDYVEQHHIPDSLVGKLERLIGPPPKTPPSVAPHAETLEGRQIKEAAQQLLDPLPALDPQLVERAERLAWLIVSDIALYNGAALDGAKHLDDKDELEARLRMDLEEGRLLFDIRVPAEVRKRRDFIGDALERLRRERM